MDNQFFDDEDPFELDDDLKAAWLDHATTEGQTVEFEYDQDYETDITNALNNAGIIFTKSEEFQREVSSKLAPTPSEAPLNNLYAIGAKYDAMQSSSKLKSGLQASMEVKPPNPLSQSAQLLLSGQQVCTLELIVLTKDTPMPDSVRYGPC